MRPPALYIHSETFATKRWSTLIHENPIPRIETLPAGEASHDVLGYLYEHKQEKARKKAGAKEGAAVPAAVDAKDLTFMS